MKEHRIKKATIARSGIPHQGKGINLEILDDSGHEHRLYGTPEEMFELGRKILQALPLSFTQQTENLISGRTQIESRLRAISHNLSTEHHSGNQ